ncbi:hypothetical protein C4F51_08785 [Cellvibrio sp. KB43]|uniref:Uncharacterized protein n=1 Tax=Cellvibrio polysaccharolyticus TaxID=2082724 RepID=A0A928YT82_9GAMM|nr:hypothetical protein [Cellvibrio polysaccharolyticus]
MKNPITAILRSKASTGIKWIAFSLMVVLVSAMPSMLYALFGPGDGSSMTLTLIFAVGALLGHIGFLIGLLLLLRDAFFNKK